MLDRTVSKRARLIQARDLFESACDHYEDSRDYMEEDAVFYHNVDGESQWAEEDLKYLREQNRPALTFNLVFNKVNQCIGLHEDHKHQPRVTPASGSPRDIALAEVANTLLHQARKCAHMDDVDSLVFEYAVTMGEGNAHISVDMDPETPGWLTFAAIAQHGLQVMWDTASEAQNRSDARYSIWDKWVTFDQFKIDYPEFKDKAKKMFDDGWNGAIFMDEGAGGFESDVDDRDDYEAEFGDTARYRFYVDRKYRKVRIVHLEYETLVKRHFMITPSKREEIDSKFMATAKKARDEGDIRFAGMSFISTWDTKKFWFEFIGTDVLFDDYSPEPHDMYTLVPMMCFQDSRTGYAYGIVRNMKDPQRDVNKAHSQSLDHLNTQAKPGWIAEEGAIPNPDTFVEANRQASSVAYVRAGALSGAQVKERPVPSYSEAANQRLTQAVTLLNLVSGIASDPEDPARGVEAATTVAIRERKALRALTKVLRRFENYQIRASHLFLESIVTAMPDDQIAAWLGDSGSYRVMGSQIIQIDEQTGKPRPVAPIRDFRLLKYAVELEPSSTSDTSRLMMLNIIMQLYQSQTGVPIDPTLVYDLLSTDRATRERLRQFAKETAMQSAQASQQQLQMLGMQAQADMTEAQAKAGKAMADVKLQKAKQTSDEALGILDLWVKADKTEKDFVTKMMDATMQRKRRDQESSSPATTE